MNETTTLRRGDRIFLQYGCMCGDDTGTVLAEVTNRWGTHWVVRLSDFTTTTIQSPIDTVTERDGVIQGASQIGSYLIN